MLQERKKPFLGICYIFIIVFLQYSYVSSNHTRTKRAASDIAEASMTTPLLIQKYGYPSELHTVTTPDGYLLELHRIPYGKKSPPCRRRKKAPVLLMHDIISSSSDFIINGPERSLGYLLADNGYDVWMGNVRGNRYSRNHRSKSPSSTNFWDFTFHEMGAIDLPTIFEFILKKTEQQKLFYVGHSMGSTIYHVLLSERPEYNNKIAAAFHMSPVVFLNNMKSPILKFLSFFTNPIGLFMDIIGVGEFLPKWELLAQLGRFMCKGDDFAQPVCTHVLFMFSGFDGDNLDMERFAIYMGHTPAGASTRTFMHYGQICSSGTFRKHNLGVVGNMFAYSNIKPPMYNLKSNKVPLYLFYAADDWFASIEDVNTLYKELQESTAIKIEVQDPRFAHVDFVFGKNAREMVYNNLISLMKKHKL